MSNDVLTPASWHVKGQQLCSVLWIAVCHRLFCFSCCQLNSNDTTMNTDFKVSVSIP